MLWKLWNPEGPFFEFLHLSFVKLDSRISLAQGNPGSLREFGGAFVELPLKEAGVGQLAKAV